MPTYASPGVYVEEVPSVDKPIAGVGTSTAGFIGIVSDGPFDQPLGRVKDKRIGVGDGSITVFDLGPNTYPVKETAGSYEVRVDGVVTTGATLDNNDSERTSAVTFTTAPAADKAITVDYVPAFSPVAAGEPQLCVNFTDFKRSFGDFWGDTNHNNLAHAVYGFFNNGGSRCFVMRVAAAADIPDALVKFEAEDEIALVAAPGIVDKATRDAIDTHCRVLTQDRFAIFDSDEAVEKADGTVDTTLLAKGGTKMPPNSDYAAFYFPWIQVFDAVKKKITDTDSDGMIFVPPSGHVAGVYARVDTQRGVHKAPGNEALLGALGLKYKISKALQDGLNLHGVNVIRNVNGNIRLWGARTIGGDDNADLKYINVRRTLLFLRESIDEGTQWVVFEPNTAALWQKITRNVSAFLTNVWRSGALFGTTPAEAFYVKCDAELNPASVRDLGQVVTEVGVAIVRPAEFVIFRISQWTAPGK
ncbi:MAG: phage tail sheath C-terminal domain-containing protein [Pyrinomonadaceae bacterium]